MKIFGVRRFFVVFLMLCLALPLVAATTPASILGTPTLYVYPFAVNGSDVTREAGSRLAVAIATQIADLGGVTVKPAPPGVNAQNYLLSAHADGIQYYIAGYVTPLGDGVSIVEQLVSTQSGIVVFSNTAQVRSYADAAGQGDVLRDALLRHQTRNLGAYAAPPPPAQTSSPTPAPGAGAQANLGRLFGRRQRRSTAQSSPSPAATSATARSTPVGVAVAPALAGTQSPAARPPAAQTASTSVARVDGFALLAIGGTADAERRAFTGAAVRNIMLARHRRVLGDVAAGPSACASAPIDTLVGGNLMTQSHIILGTRATTATLDFVAYDCSGDIVYRKTFANDARGGWKNAVDQVVRNAVAAFLARPPAARHDGGG